MRALVERLTAERLAASRRPRIRRMSSMDNLPMPRVFLYGPRWRRHFDVQEIPIAEIDSAAASYHRPGRKLLIVTLEPDVRERVLDELRPGVFAEWASPLERLGI